MKTKCKNVYCENEFLPKNETHQYCSSQCRKESFEERKHTENARIGTPVQTPVQTNVQTNVTETMERILREREEVFLSKLRAMETEHEKKILELRLTELEHKVKDLEKELDGNGTNMSELLSGAIQGYMTYQSSKPTPPIK
jgi:hypothetical protein